MIRLRQYILVICTFGFTSLFAQTEGTHTSFLDSVNAVVKDGSSEYFYSRLLTKVRTNGVALTKDDMFYLYYGQLKDGRKPLSVVANPEVSAFLNNIKKGKCKKAIPIGMKILNRSPADLTTLLHMAICAKGSHQADLAFLDTRFRLLLDAIFSTGDGLTKETARKISNVEDDLVLKGVMGFLGGSESLAISDHKSYSVWRKNGETIYFEDLWTF